MTSVLECLRSPFLIESCFLIVCLLGSRETACLPQPRCDPAHHLLYRPVLKVLALPGGLSHSMYRRNCHKLEFFRGQWMKLASVFSKRF